MASPAQVFLLPLKDNGSPDMPGDYIYLPPPSDPPYVLRFVIEGSSSICRQGDLWVNIPENGQAFDRSKFRSFGWASSSDHGLQIDC
jgi:glycogen debranching enzyme